RTDHRARVPIRARLARRPRIPPPPGLRRPRLLRWQARLRCKLRWPVGALCGAQVVGHSELSHAARQRQSLQRWGARRDRRRPFLRRAPRAQRAAREGRLRVLSARWPAFIAAPLALSLPAAHATVYLSVE